jgi:hypothetical protein
MGKEFFSIIKKKKINMKVTALLLVGLICISAFNIDLFEKHKLNSMPNRNIMEVMV